MLADVDFPFGKGVLIVYNSIVVVSRRAAHSWPSACCTNKRNRGGSRCSWEKPILFASSFISEAEEEEELCFSFSLSFKVEISVDVWNETECRHCSIDSAPFFLQSQKTLSQKPPRSFTHTRKHIDNFLSKYKRPSVYMSTATWKISPPKSIQTFKRCMDPVVYYTDPSLFSYSFNG